MIAFWLKGSCASLSLNFYPSRPPMADHLVFVDPVVRDLLAYIGLDHRARARLSSASRDLRVVCDSPGPEFAVFPITPQPGGLLARQALSEPYSRFRDRARSRVASFRADRLAAHPPVDAMGHPVYVAWDLATSLRSPTPLTHLSAFPGIRVSNDRAAPLRTAYADPRYWCGDSSLFWGQSGFPDAWYWPPTVWPPWRLGPWPRAYSPWPWGRMPDPLRLGQSGAPHVPFPGLLTPG